MVIQSKPFFPRMRAIRIFQNIGNDLGRLRPFMDHYSISQTVGIVLPIERQSSVRFQHPPFAVVEKGPRHVDLLPINVAPLLDERDAIPNPSREQGGIFIDQFF
jgi:hypothetical protein